MDPVNKSETHCQRRKYNSYKTLLESAVMVPFRRLGFLSSNPVFPVLLDQVEVKVDRASESTTKYVIDLSYGKHKWRITENVVHIFSLNTYLYYKGITNVSEDRPNLYTEERYDCVERFLRRVLHKARLLDIGKVYDFFKISKHSFMGDKGFEDKFYVEISEDRENRSYGAGCCDLSYFRKVYIVCKKTHLIFVDYKNKHKDMDVLFYTGDLRVRHSRHTFYSKILISRDRKMFAIKSFNHGLIFRLVGEISKAESDLRNRRRFLSFSPVRRNNIVNFYVDGKNYFENLYETLKLARNEVFIAGWWIYPTLYLKRKVKNGVLNKTYRLDHVLKKMAENGIKIRILIYREFQMALTINSNYTYEALSRLHKNIDILRHPNAVRRVPIYWSHHEKIVVIDQKVAYLGGIDLALGRYDTQEHELFDRKSVDPGNEIKQQVKSAPLHVRGMKDVIDLVKNDEEGCVWPGMDFSNPLKKDFVNVENGDRSLIDRHITPRMPWHDIQCKIVGSSAFDVSRHFVEKWNFVARLEDDFQASLLIPNGDLLEDQDRARTECYLKNHHGATVNVSEDTSFIMTQVLRSVGSWSLGLERERSIERGYSEVISSARSFIYIENQFFITRCNEEIHEQPENTLGARLAERIIRAHMKSESFKVYVVIPLLPAFETNFATNTSSNIKEIVKVQLESISKGEKSLIHVLKRNGVDPRKYIAFMSLRKAYYDGKRASQEQIYIHSKLLIADGTSAIVGSANFNDRSMLGERDAEIALLLEDKHEKVVSKLLKQLLIEHLGLCGKKIEHKGHDLEEVNVNVFLERLSSENKLCNLGDESVFNAIVSRAEINTRIFRELFRSLPDDEIRTAEDYVEFSKQIPLYMMDIDRKVIQNAFSRIKGHFVLFPYNFLSEEQLKSSLLSIQGLIPSVVFY